MSLVVVHDPFTPNVILVSSLGFFLSIFSGFVLIPILPDATIEILGIASLLLFPCISLSIFLSWPIVMSLTSYFPCSSFKTCMSNSTFSRSILEVVSSYVLSTFGASRSSKYFISYSSFVISSFDIFRYGFQVFFRCLLLVVLLSFLVIPASL